MALEYIRCRIIFPPDDTASDLTPASPGINNHYDLQEPGTIKQGALFQIESGGGGEQAGNRVSL